MGCADETIPFLYNVLLFVSLQEKTINNGINKM
jgi:hypothetical protein